MLGLPFTNPDGRFTIYRLQHAAELTSRPGTLKYQKLLGTGLRAFRGIPKLF